MTARTSMTFNRYNHESARIKTRTSRTQTKINTIAILGHGGKSDNHTNVYEVQPIPTASARKQDEHNRKPHDMKSIVLIGKHYVQSIHGKQFTERKQTYCLHERPREFQRLVVRKCPKKGERHTNPNDVNNTFPTVHRNAMTGRIKHES